jgi:hypothetical protein
MERALIRQVYRTAVLIVLAVSVCYIHVKADIFPLVLTGDAIPGTANFRFIGFGQSEVNTSGTVAFRGDFADPATGLTGQGIFKRVGGQIVPVMLEGQPLPDVPGRSFGGAIYGPWINNNGDILFTAYTNEPLPPQRTLFVGFAGVFVESGGTLRRIVDYNTPVPGSTGQAFTWFGENLQINDRGDIAFAATMVNGGGIFLLSQGVLQQVATTGEPVFSLNNKGDIAFIGSGGLTIFSGGSYRSTSLPATVPGTNLSSGAPMITGMLSNNDNGDVAYVNISVNRSARIASLVQDAVVRWSSSDGSFQKVAAQGDPVPGLSGFTFGDGFISTSTNQAATVFQAMSAQGTLGPDIIGRYQGGQLSTLANAQQFVDGIGPLGSLGSPGFDSNQGPIVTFRANAGDRANTGIYAASTTAAYTTRFPHIADGGGGGAGGWRTTFVLANRSVTPANATIAFFDDNGNALSLAVGGSSQSQTSIVVPALGVAQVQTQGGGPLTTGWALTQSDQNLTGIAIFGLLDGSGNAVTEVGVPASLALNSLSVFAQNSATTSTGVALANPNNTAANVTLSLKDSNSTQLAQTTLTIPPMGHLAHYANELFPTMPPGEFQGKIEVLSTQPLAGLTLRQRGSIFTSLPVIP